MSGKKPAKSSVIRELFKTKKLAAAGIIVLMLFLLVAIFADALAPYPMVDGVLKSSIMHKLEPPSLAHPMGTDTLGRDVLSYLIYGARTSVILALCCTAISTTVSLFIGVTSAVIGGKFDLFLQRFVDAWQCIPGMLITLILMSVLGNGMLQLILVLSIPGGIGGSRLVRSTAISVKDSGYVKMSKMLGAGTVWKMVKHVIPNIMPIIIMGLAGSIGGVIMAEASMNFLGFGVDLNTPSWAALLTGSGRSHLYQAPWLALFPGICITVMIVASALLGDGMRDILDPRLRGGVGTFNSKRLEKIIAVKRAKRDALREKECVQAAQGETAQC